MEALIPCLIFPAFVALAIVLGIQARSARARELKALARGLEGGRAVAPDDFFSGLRDCSVVGRLDGHEVLVRFERRGAGKHKYHVAILEVIVKHPAASFEVAEAGLLDRLGRWLGVSEDTLGDDDLVLRRGAGEARRLIQAGAVKVALRRVLALDGVSAVSLQGSALRIEQRHPAVTARALRAVLDAMIRLAQRCDRVPVKVTVREAKPRFAWTDGGADARCPFCRDALDPDAEAVVPCGRCRTVHHRACLDEAGGCTVFGCGERAQTQVRAQA